jgi:ribosome biogenesis GTPase
METMRGIVIAVRPRWVLVRTAAGEIACDVPRRFMRGARDERTPLVVGDRGTLEVDTRGRGRFLERDPRRTKLARLGSLRPLREHVIAANIDQLLALQSVAEPDFNAHTLDRLLLLGESGGVRCAVALNKIDLQASPDEDRLAAYRRAGYPCFRVCALTGAGMAPLAEFLAGHETVLLGASGVGKSTLLNRLIPEAEQRTAEVSKATGRGIHTTTRVDYLDLPAGGAVLDTPGIRTIQPFGIPLAGLAAHFPEFRDRLGGCRFKDCRHAGEPGCAIHEAVEAGEIDAGRYESYRRILDGLGLDGEPAAGLDPHAEGE